MLLFWPELPSAVFFERKASVRAVATPLSFPHGKRPPAAYFFLACQKKVCKKETLENEIALPRLKSKSFRCAFCRYTVRRQNALRAAVQSGFPSARYAVLVALFAPVEYLTYGSRKSRSATCSADKMYPKQTQSISMTSPVYQRRICLAFCKSENKFRTNQAPGKIQGRGPQPPSWSF